MSKRDEPEILADLIRLAERMPNYYGVDCSLAQSLQAEADAELIEQARAVLHRYVVAAGRKQIAVENSLSFPRLMIVMCASLVTGMATAGAIFQGWPVLLVAPIAFTAIVLGAYAARRYLIWRNP